MRDPRYAAPHAAYIVLFLVCMGLFTVRMLAGRPRTPTVEVSR